jgi:hypothetical protein
MRWIAEIIDEWVHMVRTDYRRGDTGMAMIMFVLFPLVAGAALLLVGSVAWLLVVTAWNHPLTMSAVAVVCGSAVTAARWLWRAMTGDIDRESADDRT